MTIYQEVQCRSACHKVMGHKSPSWFLNVYRGCEHRCRYCYAIYSHQYLQKYDPADYFQTIFVKSNIVELLEKQLRLPSWKREIISLNSVTDCYQPCEERYQFMPQILKLMIKYKNPIHITTKSDLILRDFDLIDELARLTYVGVTVSVTTVDEKLQKELEPGAVSFARRLNVLKEFSKTEVIRGVHMMPLVPLITDTYQNLECLMHELSSVAPHYAAACLLRLCGQTRGYFLNYIGLHYQHLLKPLTTLYQGQYPLKEYADGVYQMLEKLMLEYGINRYEDFRKRFKFNQENYKQLSLL